MSEKKVLTIRVEHELHQRINDAAHLNRVSQNEWCIAALLRALATDEAVNPLRSVPKSSAEADKWS